MLVARDQENLVAHHHNGVALKQQQARTPGARYPKTPAKIPLNDENANHMVGGAKSILGGRTKGNENAMTSKGLKGADKSNFITPMGPRTRAVLGNKTTNAKAQRQGQGTLNAKSAIKEIETSKVAGPSTVRPKQKAPQAELQKKLEVHTEEAGPLSEEEVEYCPPKPKDLPYESDVFPDGALTFEALKPENLFQGYYQHYFNPVDENGVSQSDRELEEKNRKVAEECDRRVQQDMDEFDWSIGDIPASKDFFKKKQNKLPAPVADPIKAANVSGLPAPRKPLATIASRNAASALSINDGTRSIQRKALKTAAPDPVKKKTTFGIAGLKTARHPTQQHASIPRKTSMEIRAIEANSRSTIGHNKGRVMVSALSKGTTRPVIKPSQFKSKVVGLPRSETTTSIESDATITPARYAHQRVTTATEDEQWKERVPFLSIFNPEDDDELDLAGPGMPPVLDEDEEEFQMTLPE
ncbi:uncharacterized protein BCR38DRAFT_405024 [Pseudomassariella vexata]|uniref:Uncharacterized protein n=1 Tax=Pseudomassariella vexata TaxID=1141098 RepID=A0A1Y2EKF0_9PEZI|nr:uncharacterized protein BCR38DRAFT_405024 [Pseudomassariella vexata]ORY72010.1 hypothetical protein BCR38DRAFT_405024 [Pseudomassariella vexata]